MFVKLTLLSLFKAGKYVCVCTYERMYVSKYVVFRPSSGVEARFFWLFLVMPLVAQLLSMPYV